MTPAAPDLPLGNPSRVARFAEKRRRWLLLALLACLHLALLQGPHDAVGKMLTLGHFGLFILWQPFVRAEQRLSGLQMAAIVAVVAAATLWLGWWLLILWTMVLAGIVGGKVFYFGARWTKLYYLLVLAYLLIALLVMEMPQVIPPPFAVPEIFSALARYALPLVFLVMAALPVESEEAKPEVVDFVYSMFVFLLLAVLVLGSVAFMLLAKAGYISALLYTLMVMSAVLFVLGWTWNPRAGFSGLGILFSRYLLSIGMPVEQWLHYLAEHSQREHDPQAFLAEALAGMTRLPWVSGGEWSAAEHRGEFGERRGSRSEFVHPQLRVALYSRHDLSPALAWHFNLLTQLVGEFYVAKLRGEQLQRLSYVQAIHETGARLTHDVKNLLQSLNMLCFAAAQEGLESSPEFQALLRRQLPAIAQRLQQTLDKLRRPGAETGQFMPLAEWWRALQQRYAGSDVSFSPPDAECRTPVPATLFSSVAENLLQNALDKRHGQPGLKIHAMLTASDPPAFAVCDDGRPISGQVLADLFRAPVASASGLGIGLYQAARHAEYYGYELRVAHNAPGNVCLELAGRDSGGDASETSGE